MAKTINERIEREKASYDQKGMKAENITALIPRLECLNNTPAWLTFQGLTRELMNAGKDKILLEVGSQSWSFWIDFINYSPKKLICINISESELAKGMEIRNRRLGLEHNLIEFRLMDAHFLKFPDATFDIVFGGAILHHLNIETAMKEIFRVLKPGGAIIFCEPLIHNPVGKIVRLLTPHARTSDERPLGVKELKLIDQFIPTKNYFTQLFDVPFGIISSYFFKDQDNLLTRLSYNLDSFLTKLPYLKYLYRYVLIFGIKK